jgi:hypothetical protein
MDTGLVLAAVDPGAQFTKKMMRRIRHGFLFGLMKWSMDAE